MTKSPEAFRTISEVAEWLGIQAHVLRFWESKFTQVKPVKRAGGRRYYRPNDMLLLGGIKQLLHEDGLTIKGVQKLLREEGMTHVASMSQPLDELTQSQLDDSNQTPFVEAEPDQSEETGVVLHFEQSAAKPSEPERSVTTAKSPDVVADTTTAEIPQPQDQPPEEQTSEEPAPVEEAPAAEPEEPDQTASAATAEPVATLPDFLRRPTAPIEQSDNAPAEPVAASDAAPEPQPEPEPEHQPEPEEPLQPAPSTVKPRIIDLPPFTPLADIAAAPGTLSAAHRTRSLTAAQVTDIAPLVAKLSRLHDSMSAQRRPAAHKGVND